MAVRVSVQHVLNQIQDEGLIYWQVKDGRSLIHSQDRKITVDESRKQLQDFLDTLDGDFVTIVASNRSREEKSKGNASNHKQLEFGVSLRGKNAIGGSGSSEKLLREISDLKLQLQNQSWESKFSELRRELIDDKDKGIAGMLEPHMPTLVPAILGYFGIPPAVSSPALAGPEVMEVTKDEYRVRLNNALRSLAEVDNEMVLVLEALASIAQNDPKTYFNYRPMLLKLKS